MATEDTQTDEGDVREKAACEMGKRIAQARREVGFRTAQDFSDALDVSVWTVRSWESGKSQPRYHMLNTISQLLDRPQGWFLGEGAIHDRLDRVMGDLLARRQVHEERDGDEAGVYGIPVVDQPSEEELQALSSDARDWGILIRLTTPIPPAGASEIAALHLALANLMAVDEPAQ